MGCFDGCRSTCHYRAWFMTCWLLFFIVSYIVCAVDIGRICQCDCSWYIGSDLECDANNLSACKKRYTRYAIDCGFPCSMTYKIGAWFWIIVTVTYLLYIGEVFCCSSSRMYL